MPTLNNHSAGRQGVNKMSKAWNDVKKELLSNPEVKAEYDKLAPEYEELSRKIKGSLTKTDKNND